MDQSKLHSIEAHCTQEAMPTCQAHCPLHVDVRAFMGAMQNGKLAEGRKVLEKHLPIPNILGRICDHPCENHCLRRDFGGSLAIHSLEKRCLDNTQKQGKAFPRPPKAQRIAVFGNGVAALVVAFELGKKNFPVTLFYENNPHDFLLKNFPALRAEHIESELLFLQKQHLQLEQVTLSADFFKQVQNEAQGFDALFVDMHAAPQIAECLQAVAGDYTMFVKDNICMAGSLEQSPTGEKFASPSKQAGEGRQAALSLERLATNVSLMAGREHTLGQSKLHTPLTGLLPVSAILPAGGLEYTEQEAAEEAARCIQCECMQCVKQCVYLQKYGSFPRNYTRQIYNNTAIVLGDHKANSLINGCMLCGQCTEICPERFSMIEVVLDARQDMVEKNYMPPSAFEFAVEDMLCASQSPCALTMRAPNTSENPSHVFFPGCQLSALRSEQVFAVYEFLQQQNTLEHIKSVGLMLSCCGIPAYFAGQKELNLEHMQQLESSWQRMGKPTLIMACASCLRQFENFMPHIPCVSLWEVLVPLTENSENASTYTVSLHDPCGARTNPVWQGAVRSLAQSQGIEIVEHDLQGSSTPCCGFGGNVWCSQPELASKATHNLAHTVYDATMQDTALVSCIMCLERLEKIGKKALHVLDILPFIPKVNTQTLGMSARRAARAGLAEKVLQSYGTDGLLHSTEHGTDNAYAANACLNATESHLFLHISAELLQELERRHILHQDVALAVRMVEEHKMRFVESESGHFVGAWRPKNVTYWVRYSQDDAGAYHLHDAWCHRMTVPNCLPQIAVK